MTRFEREISGSLGNWWKDRAEEAVIQAVAKAETDTTVEPSGAIKWKSNGNYLPDDFCELLEYGGYTFSRKATAEAREKQQDEFLKAYRARYKGLSEEEIAELRSVHGAGTVIVDVITGDKIQL